MILKAGFSEAHLEQYCEEKNVHPLVMLGIYRMHKDVALFGQGRLFMRWLVWSVLAENLPRGNQPCVVAGKGRKKK